SFPDPPPTPLSTLSLHDALPISLHVLGCHAGTPVGDLQERACARGHAPIAYLDALSEVVLRGVLQCVVAQIPDDQPQLVRIDARSEEHTSELQSPYDLVCRLLLE